MRRGMRLTRSVASLLCEDAWSWLAVNPEKEREEWPGWEANGGSIPEMPLSGGKKRRKLRIWVL